MYTIKTTQFEKLKHLLVDKIKMHDKNAYFSKLELVIFQAQS